MIKKSLPPYVYLRKGKPYFERRGYDSQRIHATPGTPEFAIEYAKILSGVQRIPEGKTFKTLVADYRQSPKFKSKAPRTKQDYDKVLTYITDKLGTLPADRMQRKDVIKARDMNADAARFANYIVQILSILFEHAIDLGWRKDNPAHGVSYLKTGTRKRKAWPDELVAAYRKEAKGRALLIFELCLGTGQRIGDVLKMTWEDYRDGGIWITQNKTGEELFVPVTRNLKDLLESTPRIGATICAWGKGHATAYRGAADLVMEVRKKIGAEDFDLHSLRYTTAAELAAHGCSDELIMAVTGHKTRAMVAKYAGPARQKARAKQAQDSRNGSSD